MSLQFLPLSDAKNVDKIAELIKKYSTDDKSQQLADYKENMKKLIEEKQYFQLVSQTLQQIEQCTTEQKMIQQIYPALTYYVTLLPEDQQEQAIPLYYDHLTKLGNEYNAFKVRMYPPLPHPS